jgi:hypothetical protein
MESILALAYPSGNLPAAEVQEVMSLLRDSQAEIAIKTATFGHAVEVTGCSPFPRELVIHDPGGMMIRGEFGGRC